MLNKAQKEAVEYLEGPLLVLAGPGTGKTQLLSEKVAYILKNTDTSPENILCLTFTDSGAMNMRERLRGMIKSDALKVNIGTYHSFGREILAQYQQYSESYDRVLDAAVDQIMRFKIVRKILDSLPAFDILRGDSTRNVVEVISKAKAAELSAKDLAKIAEQNIEDAEVLSKAFSPLLKKAVPRKLKESYELAYGPIFEILQNYGQLKPIVGRIERSIVGMTRDLATAIEKAQAENTVKPLTDWRNAYFEKDAEGDYRTKDRVANKKLVSIARVMAQYETYMKEHGLYDFDDMIQEAVRVLKSDKGFKLTLEERYQFIMLDEFQDTNPSQFAIVKELTDYEKPMVMAVGDDDQAIYEFQGALASNLTDFRDYYDAKVISLTENYRSSQESLDFAREIIRQAPDRFADKELVAHKKNPEKSEIKRYEFMGSDAEYAFVADEIERLVKAGVPQSEIAVLAYKRKYFEPLLPYLKEKSGINIAYERRDDLLADPQIHQIVAILQYANDKAHERKTGPQLMEILGFPMFGLPALEVIKMSGKARRERKDLLEVIAEVSQKESKAALEFRQAAEWLAKIVMMSYNEPLDVVVHEIVDKMESGERLAVDKVSEGAESADERIFGDEAYEKYVFYENLASLLGKVKQHFGEQPVKVADLLEMVEDYEEAEMMLTGTNPYRDADEAVQIMTTHKAKGLEFQYVFMVSVDHRAWGKGQGNRNTLVLPKNVTQIRHTGATDSERSRLLYVALTRSKGGLVITNALHDFDGKAPDRLEYFEEYVNEDEKVISPFLPDGEVIQRYEVGTPDVREHNLRSWLEHYRPNSPEMREIYLERVRDWRMSASALTNFIDVVYAGPWDFFKNYLMNAPYEPENESIAFGDLVHKTFEAVTKQGLTDEEAIKFYLDEVEKKDLSTEEMRKIRERGTEGLKIALEAFGPIIRNGKAEVNFSAEKLVVDEIPITGKIDHIVIDEDAKTIEVYDFKTGPYHKEGWESHPTLFKDMLQLEFYKLLLNNSREFKDYAVERGHILFVTPDVKEQKVHDKAYTFTEKNGKLLKDIMTAMYGLVTSLKFLEDEELMVEPNRSKKMTDIKEFIGLMVDKNAEK